MARTIASTGTRIGIVTLTALGAFALPFSAGAAQASTPSAAANCAALQVTYDGLSARDDAAQERLATAPAPQKPALIAVILRLDAQMGQVRQQMDAAGCP